MNSIEFAKIRHYLERSQAQLAKLLGVSSRAVQSFEQGWREVSTLVERQMLFLLYMKISPTMEIRPCWQTNKCDKKMKRKCPAWEFQAGHICWFINGTVCGGKVQDSWNKKMQLCRQCEVFKALFVDFLMGI